jgi:uncharacterized DUF497 family protein
MEFEWDEDKRLSNIRKHGGLDFYDAAKILYGFCVFSSAKTVESERRWMATGLMGERYVTVIYTLRGDTVRIISMRRARHEEKRKYRAIYEH